MTTGTAEVREEYAFGIPLIQLPSYRMKKVLTPEDKTEKHQGINYELLDEIMAYIKEHPGTWHQASWFKQVDTNTGEEKYISRIEKVEELNSCGTSFCFAGHVALREGFPSPPLNNDDDWEREVNTSNDWTSYETVEEFAQMRLGFTARQAYALFAGENTIQGLEQMVIVLHVNPNAGGHDLKKYGEMTSEEFGKALPDEIVSVVEARKNKTVEDYFRY